MEKLQFLSSFFSGTFWAVTGLVLAVLLLILAAWLFIPSIAGLPWRPTARSRIRRALQMAHLQPGEVLYDLGSGDGRVLVIAAREFGAQAVGVEISPLHCWLSRVHARLEQVDRLVSVRRESFYETNLDGANVVFAYMTSAQASRLKPVLEKQLKAGARVVTISFDLDGWEPADVDRDELIFMYEMPPVSGNLETYLQKTL